ncbi:MAG: hypothetical protein ACT4PS_12500 [Betaproteobacteria bacterium]
MDRHKYDALLIGLTVASQMGTLLHVAPIPAPRSGEHGNGGVLSTQCTVIFGSENTL